MASLDTRSRRALTEFSAQFCICCALGAGPCLLSLRHWADAGPPLVLIFSLYGLLDFFRAALTRERPGGPSLNLWDQAMAFNGCAFLLRAIIHIQA